MASKKGKSSSVAARSAVQPVIKSAPKSAFVSPSELDALLEVMARHDASEIEHERITDLGSERLTIRRGAQLAHAPIFAHEGTTPRPTHAHAPASAPAVAAAPIALASEEGMAFVASPLVGTFYRAPSPDAPNFVDIGTRIRPGQRLCIVEAMKLMNEIESEIDGEIVEILVDNGKPVEFGQKLFKVKKA
ncbi:MAG: acetyl-CoA carboxylase biotin carboxyl carrier protein [Polyangiales bacterium]